MNARRGTRPIALSPRAQRRLLLELLAVNAAALLALGWLPVDGQATALAATALALMLAALP